MVSKIKKLCEERGLSLYALEKALDFGNGTIARWDTKRPSVDKIAKVARFFDKTIEYFLNE